ncbi:hypothetical protein SAMN04489727_7201 [Amycolatopsis tolypomycina]|uniref:Uncharacterized protein n=1 Tax=Amycolatopsis tolypomycina TaxID=208445 RepID=A0A1H4ZD85_9PSEU|nr:DUF5994 family protein [Amycolatopsis tolypomycina]SED27588.1 hypothetical protein SAMN04489727_7201 [Amycolatopsis tolypomycina]
MTTVGDEVRLQLKPAAGGGYVDGAWWPRSRDARVEFPDVLAAVRDQVGEVERISYPLGDGWEIAHRKLVVDGRVVRLEGFHSMQAHTVALIGTQRRLILLVVAPDTARDAATATLRTAADPDTTASAEDILAGAGHAGSDPAPSLTT